MTSFKNKNLLYKTLFTSTAISLCFSMEAHAGKKEQEAALRALAEAKARESAAATRAFQQQVAARMVPQRAAEVRRDVLQSAPVVQARAQTLVRELASGSAVTADHVAEARELISLPHAPAVQQVHQAVEERIVHDVEARAQTQSFSRVSEVHNAFESHALATPNIVATVLVRPDVLEARADFLREVAASQVREQGQLPADTLQEMATLRSLAPHRAEDVREAVTQSMIESDVVDVREVLGSVPAADAAMVEQEFRRHWDEKEVVARRVQALAEKAEHEVETQGRLSQRRAEQLAAIGRAGGAELEEPLRMVAEKVAGKMAEKGVDPDELFQHAEGVDDQALRYFKQRVEEAQKGDEVVQQERLAQSIRERAYQRAFNIYHALPASDVKDELANQLIAIFFQGDVDINDLGAAAGVDPDGTIQAAVDDLEHRFAAYSADVRARTQALEDDIDAAADAGALEGLYERVFKAYDTLTADMFEDVQAHMLNGLQRSKVFPREETFTHIAERFAAQPYAETARRVMHDLFGAYQEHLAAQIRAMRFAFAGDRDVEAVLGTLSELQDMMEDRLTRQIIAEDILPQLYALGEDPRAMAMVAAAVLAGGDTAELQALEAKVTPQYGEFVGRIVRDVLPDAVRRGYNRDTALHLVRVSQMVEAGVYDPLVRALGASEFPGLNQLGEDPVAGLFHVADEFDGVDPLHAAAQAFDAEMLRLYTAFHADTQAQVLAFRARVQAAAFTQADLAAYVALSKRAPDRELKAIRDDAFAWSYDNLLPVNHFFALYNEDDYAEADRHTADWNLQILSQGWKTYIKTTLETTFRDFSGLAAIDQLAFARLMRFEHYARGEVEGYNRGNLDGAIQYLRWITFTKNFKAGVAAGAGTYAALAAPFNGTAFQAKARALGADLDVAYDLKWAEMDGQIQATTGMIAGHDARLQNPEVFGLAFEFRDWMQDAPYQAFTESYVDELHALRVAVNFNQMARDYIATRGYDDATQRVILNFAQELTARKTLLQQAAQRMADLRARVQAQPFGDREFEELLTLQPLPGVQAVDVAAVVQAISGRLYADGELDGPAYFARFLAHFDTAAGRALIAHLGAEHDRLTTGQPMRVVRDAVAATDFNLAAGVYDPTMAQIVGFMVDPLSTPQQKERIKDLLFAKMFKAELIDLSVAGQIDQLDLLFAQFAAPPLQATAPAVLAELKAGYQVFFTDKDQEVEAFLDNIFDDDYEPSRSLFRYATEYAHLLGNNAKNYVTSTNWFRKTYYDGTDAGANYFQGLVGALDPAVHPRVMPVAVALDADFDAYVGGLQVRIQGLAAALRAPVGGGQKYTDRQFSDMYKIWSSLRDGDKTMLKDALFDRLHRVDNVRPNQFYPNAILEARYPGGNAHADSVQQKAKKFRNELLLEYTEYKRTH